MSKNKPTSSEQPAAVEQPAAAPDPRDAEIDALRAEIEALRQQPAEDPRDKALAALRAERDALTATPEGEAAELRRAVDALRAEMERMQSAQGLIPVPRSDKPEPIRYGMQLECGDTAHAQNPHATHHECEHHGTVPVRGHWELSEPMRAAANA